MLLVTGIALGPVGLKLHIQLGRPDLEYLLRCQWRVFDRMPSRGRHYTHICDRYPGGVCPWEVCILLWGGQGILSLKAYELGLPESIYCTNHMQAGAIPVYSPCDYSWGQVRDFACQVRAWRRLILMKL